MPVDGVDQVGVGRLSDLDIDLAKFCRLRCPNRQAFLETSRHRSGFVIEHQKCQPAHKRDPLWAPKKDPLFLALRGGEARSHA